MCGVRPSRRGRFLLVSLGFTLACGGSVPTPEATLASFASALREGRHEDAYTLMSTDYQRRVTQGEFHRHLEDNPTEARETALALGAFDGPVEQTATIQIGEGDRIDLRFEENRWAISSAAVDFYDQSTPRAALRSFVRAVGRQRFDIVLQLVPDADREGMTLDQLREAFVGEGREDAERLMANLEANLDSPIEQIGDRATMPYGERFTAELVRESGLWKIEDPE